MKIAFTESSRSYRGHGYRFTEPGEYEVEDATAKRLLKDFPQWFEAVNDNTADTAEDEAETQDESDAVATDDNQSAEDEPETMDESVEASKNEEEEQPSINLSKANRAQLEAYAAEIGLDVTEDMDTNKKLKEAIEAKQEEA